MPRQKATHAVVKLTIEGAEVLAKGSHDDANKKLSELRAQLEGEKKYEVAVLPLDAKGNYLLPP